MPGSRRDEQTAAAGSGDGDNRMDPEDQTAAGAPTAAAAAGSGDSDDYDGLPPPRRSDDEQAETPEAILLTNPPDYLVHVANVLLTALNAATAAAAPAAAAAAAAAPAATKTVDDLLAEAVRDVLAIPKKTGNNPDGTTQKKLSPAELADFMLRQCKSVDNSKSLKQYPVLLRRTKKTSSHHDPFQSLKGLLHDLKRAIEPIIISAEKQGMIALDLQLQYVTFLKSQNNELLCLLVYARLFEQLLKQKLDKSSPTLTIEDAETVMKIIDHFVTHISSMCKNFSTQLEPALSASTQTFVAHNRGQLAVQAKMVEFDSSEKQRLFDRLARILTPSNTLTACLAVVQNKNKFYIATNELAANTEIIAFSNLIRTKHRIIEYYLKYSSADIDDTIQHLTIAGGLLSYKSETLTSADRIKQDLIKLKSIITSSDADSELKQIISDFLSDNQPLLLIPVETGLQETMSTSSIGIVKFHLVSPSEYPNVVLVNSVDDKRYPTKDLHAELILAAFALMERTHQTTNPAAAAAAAATATSETTQDKEKIHLGISKLCCNNCRSQLQQINRGNPPAWIIATGTHGITFPGGIRANILGGPLSGSANSPTPLGGPQNLRDSAPAISRTTLSKSPHTLHGKPLSANSTQLPNQLPDPRDSMNITDTPKKKLPGTG